jgi:type II secretory pathway component PulM
VNALLARLRSFWEGLAPRERVLVAAASAALGLALVAVAIVGPALSASARATQRVAAAEQELEAVRRLRHDYDEIHGRLAAVEERIRGGPRGEIFTLLESLARQSAVSIDSMEPRTSAASPEFAETRVQLELKGLSLAQLAGFLNRVETAPQLLSIKSLRIRTRADKPELLDATVTVSSFEPAGEAG